MPKCSGVIGYSLVVETQPGIWSETIIDKPYYGEVITDNRKYDNNAINEDLNISNKISIVSNSFMLENLAMMKYLTFLKSKWKITSVEMKPPRIIITIGGLYNA